MSAEQAPSWTPEEERQFDELLATLEPDIAAVSASTARDAHYVEAEDVRQVVITWLWLHLDDATRYMGTPDGVRAVRVSMSREARRYAAKIRKLHYPDWQTYSNAAVEEMLGVFFNRAEWLDHEKSNDTGTISRTDPAEGGNRLASMSDLSRAFDRLTEESKRLLVDTVKIGMSSDEVAAVTGKTPEAVRKQKSRVMAKLAATMTDWSQR